LKSSVIASVAAIIVAVTVTSLPVLATPGFWQAATQADFLRGDVENLSIDEHGRLMLGPEVRRLYETGVPFVWTARGSRRLVFPRDRQRGKGRASRSQWHRLRVLRQP
jgi:hypothetical protein